jgi:hypothetical protein
MLVRTIPATGAGVRAPRPFSAFSMPAAGPDTKRRCGECTACCQGWLTGNIRGHEIEPGVPCPFLGAHGCTIYEDRPQDPCRGFVCGWLREPSPFPESFRPDRLGVIIVPLYWRERPAYVLVAAGREPDAALLEWMRALSAARGTPFLFNVAGRWRGYGSPEFQQDILERASRGEPLLPGMNAGIAGPCKLIPLERA